MLYCARLSVSERCLLIGVTFKCFVYEQAWLVPADHSNAQFYSQDKMHRQKLIVADESSKLARVHKIFLRSPS